MNLFEYREEPNTSEKLPTLKQYLKQVGKRKIKAQFFVTLIWKPGQWDNFTLQTEDFRYRVGKTSGLYGLLLQHLDELVDNEQAIAITISEDRKTIGIVPMKERGNWVPIGENGLRFEQI